MLYVQLSDDRNMSTGLEGVALLQKVRRLHLLDKPATQQKTHNLFWPDENSIEQCCAAHIVQGCQQYCSTLLHPIAG